MRILPDHAWIYSPATRSYCFFEIPKEGAWLEGDPIVTLSYRQYEMLKDWMVDNDPHGVIRTDRKEDLKVIHRLLDVVENHGLQGSAKAEER